MSGTFTGSGAELPVFPSHFIWILKALHSLWSAFLWREIDRSGKCAHLPVPLFSHSTGFSIGSHWLNQIDTVRCTCWKTQVGVPKLKEHRRQCIPIVSGCRGWGKFLAAQVCRACRTSFGLWNVCCSESQCFAETESCQKRPRRNSGVIYHNSGVISGLSNQYIYVFWRFPAISRKLKIIKRNHFVKELYRDTVAGKEGLLGTYSLVCSWKSLLGHTFAYILWRFCS